jgi:hypothetical protein
VELLTEKGTRWVSSGRFRVQGGVVADEVGFGLRDELMGRLRGIEIYRLFWGIFIPSCSLNMESPLLLILDHQLGWDGESADTRRRQTVYVSHVWGHPPTVRVCHAWATCKATIVSPSLSEIASLGNRRGWLHNERRLLMNETHFSPAMGVISACRITKDIFLVFGFWGSDTGWRCVDP